MATAEQIEEMLARVSLGDRKAFSDLYDATCAKLFAICLRIMKDKAAAEDALQETYMKVWRYADRYASNGVTPMSWIITIARNTAIDKLRATRQTDDIDEMYDVIEASDPTPEQVAMAADEAERIRVCLGMLDPPKDKAVRGAYLEGHTYADLAKKFDVPLNTMRTWLRRSLISLRECMSQ